MNKLLLKILFLSFALVGCGGGGSGGAIDTAGSDDTTPAAQSLFRQALSSEESGDNSQAFILYTQSANLGHSGAQNNLGLMYQKGIATNVDYNTANNLFKKSADQNNRFGQYNLGYSYYTGLGVAIDYSKAFTWLSASAQQDHYSAQNLIGVMYEDGNGVAKDDAKAIEWYKKSSDNGSSQGKYNLGRVNQYGISVEQNYGQAYHWYQLASQSFHSASLYKLAVFEINGWGRNKDSALAFLHLSQSANRGYSEAQYLLGRAYSTGKIDKQEVTTPNPEQARYWYSEASKQGHKSAKNNLALLFVEGEGGATNYDAAHSLLLELANDNDIIGQLNLAEMYELGHVGKNNFSEALSWYRKAEALCDEMTDQTDYCAAVKVALGNLYQKGLAVSLNYQTALDYFNEAATVNYPNAFTRIGVLYLKGLGVSQDYTEARAWFDKAISAELSDPAAEVEIGHLYAKGLGVTQDLAEAKRWYNKGIAQEYSPAFTYMGDLNSPSNALYWYRKAIKKYSYDPRALFEIGKICSKLNNYGCNQEEKSKNWYELAAQAGHLEALYYVAEQSFQQSNFHDAATLYEQAANRNHIESLLKIAELYSNGSGVSADPAKSSSFYLKAAELGSPHAQYQIALNYSSGYGVSNNYSNSLMWLERSHTQGYVPATVELGKHYEQGHGVTQDYSRAKTYYLNAALKANKDAQYRLGYMYLNGIGSPADATAGKAWLLQAATKGHVEAHALTYSPIKNVYDNGNAIAVLRQDGSVITWGATQKGGNSISVREELTQEVSSIYFSDDNGFVALKDDGSVVVWGDKYVTDFASVASNLISNTRSIHAGYGSFAALKNDGSAVTWGFGPNGGDSSAVKSKLSSGVEKIITGEWFISAIKSGGELVVWGDVNQADLDGSLSSLVVDVDSNVTAAVAVKSDGTIVTFPRSGWANVYPSHIPSSELGTVSSVHGGHQALAVLNTNGRMLWWNYNQYITPFSSNISHIYASKFPACFVAHESDGTLHTWSMHSGVNNVPQTVASVDTIATTARGFAALKSDGSLVSWHYDSSTYDLNFYSDAPTSGVKSVYSNYSSFAAIKNDGSASSWGTYSSTNVSHKLADNVTAVYPISSGFIATKTDGEVVHWGSFLEGRTYLENVAVEPDIVLNPPN